MVLRFECRFLFLINILCLDTQLLRVTQPPPRNNNTDFGIKLDMPCSTLYSYDKWKHFSHIFRKHFPRTYQKFINVYLPSRVVV
jgi:hypothetical protein